ncbi:mucin-19 isoform X2 [Dermacentor silvarum]|uniref:mucin-19 isoform X2 n=1 Tax=Dermacentor silvarum TaxID=543639 RepID=UPI00210111CC|nr:mucin-19 isoform X2 [Dermacentor silvarum]
MQHIAIFIVTIFCAVASGQEPTGSPQCGCLEVPALGSHRKEKFCRSHLTPASELNKPRNCICRPGLVRNSWGDCITKHECMRCKCFRDKDFNVCRRACPVMCNEPIRGSCSKKCVLGCDCPPGFLRDPTKKYRCVKAAKCVLKCPQNSKFQFCVSTCAPKCGARPPKICVTRCQRAGCVCDQGYAEVEQNGETMCVPQGECYRYLGLAASLTPGGHANVGGGISSAGTAVLPGGVVGSAVGTVSTGTGVFPPGTVGTAGVPSISGSGVGGTVGTVSTGAGGILPGSVGTIGVPSIPGSVVRGTVGTISTGAGVIPPGSVDIEGASSRGTYGFGATSGGIYSKGIGPDDSMESGEGSVRGDITGASPTYPGPNGAIESLPGSEGIEPVGVAIGTEGSIPLVTSAVGGVGGGLMTGGTIPAVVGRPGGLGVGTGTSTFGQNSGGFPRPATTTINIAGTPLSGSAGSSPNGVSTGSTLRPLQGASVFGTVGSGIAATSIHAANPVQPGTAATGINAEGAGGSGAGGLAPVVSGTSTPVGPITDATGSRPGFVGTETLGAPSLATSLTSGVGTSLVTAGTLSTVPVIPSGVTGGSAAVGSGLPATGVSGPISVGSPAAGTPSSVTTGFSSSAVVAPTGGSEFGSNAGVGVVGSSIGAVSAGTGLTRGTTLGSHLGGVGSAARFGSGIK